MFLENFATINRKGLGKHATAWMDLKGIMLSERSQSQKVTYLMIPLK